MQLLYYTKIREERTLAAVNEKGGARLSLAGKRVCRRAASMSLFFVRYFPILPKIPKILLKMYLIQSMIATMTLWFWLLSFASSP